jgi:GTPase Era involved in 16S rRNA processing
VARAAAEAYLEAMPLPRPASPRALWADIKAFAAQRSPHQWVAAALAVAMPVALIVLFISDTRRNIAPGPQLIYVESWPASRSDAEIIAQQKIDQAKRDKAMKERQRQFKKLDESLERMGI